MTMRKFMRGRGCSHCNGTGFAGRTGVYEMLEMTPELVRAVGRADPGAFADAARPQLEGKSLTARALELVLAGRTTVSEVVRVATDVEG
jgi:MSHA biogenesis protein MshE